MYIAYSLETCVLGVERVPSRGVLRFFEAFLGMSKDRKDKLGVVVNLTYYCVDY
jgi:hypothetical protein